VRVCVERLRPRQGRVGEEGQWGASVWLHLSGSACEPLREARQAQGRRAHLVAVPGQEGVEQDVKGQDDEHSACAEAGGGGDLQVGGWASPMLT